MTGSALLALALLRGRMSEEGAWAAAHVDEDWNMDFWGRDARILERRAYRFAEMQAAAAVLRLVPLSDQPTPIARAAAIASRARL